MLNTAPTSPQHPVVHGTFEVQVNIRAGELPPREDNGVAYLKVPINALWQPLSFSGASR